jgi:hypothetical protein
MFEGGETHYYLTYGRVHDAVDPRPIERAVRRYVDRPTRRVASVELCDTLAAASRAPYFYEGLFHFSNSPIPFGDGYAEWRDEQRNSSTKARVFSTPETRPTLSSAPPSQLRQSVTLWSSVRASRIACGALLVILAIAIALGWWLGVMH